MNVRRVEGLFDRVGYKKKKELVRWFGGSSRKDFKKLRTKGGTVIFGKETVLCCNTNYITVL